jgi:spore germination protein (amino acid permease)
MRIGPWQLLALLANMVFGKSLGYTNGTLARVVGNDAWISMATAFLWGMAFLPALVWLSRRRSGELPVEYIPKLVGRWLGAIVMLLLSLFCFVAFMTSAITIEQHINDYLMTETPLIIFVVGYTLLIMYGVYLGVEVAARLSILGLLLNIAFNISLAAGSVHHMDWSRLLPMFDHGVLPVLTASIRAYTDVGMATSVALLLLPITEKPQQWLRFSWWGLGLGAVLVLTWSLFEITVLGPEVTGQYLIACMQLARAAELSIYLHRYEMIMVVLFVYGVISQSIALLYCATELLAAALPFQVRRGYLVATVSLLSIGPQYYLAYDRERYGTFLAVVWPPISVALAFVLPLLLVVIAMFRPKASTKSG